VLRNAVEAGRTDEWQAIRLLQEQPSLAATRRLGLLFELVRGTPHPEMLRIARLSATVSKVADGREVDPTWRITLPFGRDRIRRAMK
jgi:hypothetical protein